MKRRERSSLTGTRWLGGQRLMTVAELEQRQVTHVSPPPHPINSRSLDLGIAPVRSVWRPNVRETIPPAAFYSRVHREQSIVNKTRGEIAAGTYTKPIHCHLYGSSAVFLPPQSFFLPLLVQQVLRQ